MKINFKTPKISHYLLSLLFTIFIPILVSGKIGYKVEMSEMLVKEYTFMTEIADLLSQTDLRCTDPNANIYTSDSCTYDMIVKYINVKEDETNIMTIDFNATGSYYIGITYRASDYLGQTPTNIFNVNNVRFTTTQNLINYFTGCKIHKCEFVFPYTGLVFNRFWDFEIRDGVIKNAFYIYEKSDDDPTTLVYDLFNKKKILYREWYHEWYQNLK